VTRDGAVSPDGLVFGTYLHGLFQNENAVKALLAYLYRRKGLRPREGIISGRTALPIHRDSTGGVSAEVAGKPDPYDQLADLFEANLDMRRILAFFEKTD
jgi:adenosylcobyric acid synthase